MLIRILAFKLLITTVTVTAFNTGAPNSACESGRPNPDLWAHGAPPQEGPCPMTLLAPIFVPGGQTEVVLYDENEQFKGFLLQIYRENGTMVGEWGDPFLTSSGQVRTVCNGRAITHVDDKLKSTIHLPLVVPEDLGINDVLIPRFTVVRSKQKYWVNCPGDPMHHEDYVAVTSTDENIDETEEPTTFISPTVTEPTTTEIPEETTTTKKTTIKSTTPSTTSTTTTPTSATTTPTTTTTIPTTTTETTTTPTTTATTPTTTTPLITTPKFTAIKTTSMQTKTTPKTTSIKTTPTQIKTTPKTTATIKTTTTQTKATLIITPKTTPTTIPTVLTQSNTSKTSDIIDAELTKDPPVNKTGHGTKVTRPEDAGVGESMGDEGGEVKEDMGIPAQSRLQHLTISESACQEQGNVYRIIPDTDCSQFEQEWEYGAETFICVAPLKFSAKYCTCTWSTECPI